MSTPAERDAVIRGLAIDEARRVRAAADQRHMPGGNADIFQRTSYWEERAEAAFAVLETAATAWRVARSNAGDWPDEDPEAIRLGHQRDTAEREYQRCRNLRDQALAELQTVYAAHRGW